MITSTPRIPRQYIIREEPHPFSPGNTIFRAYHGDNSPVYMGCETIGELIDKLGDFFLVRSLLVYWQDGTVQTI